MSPPSLPEQGSNAANTSPREATFCSPNMCPSNIRRIVLSLLTQSCEPLENGLGMTTREMLNTALYAFILIRWEIGTKKKHRNSAELAWVSQPKNLKERNKIPVWRDHKIGHKIVENGDNYSTAPWRNIRRSASGNLVSEWMCRMRLGGGLVNHTIVIPVASSLPLLRGACSSRAPTIIQNDWFCTQFFPISNFLDH